MILSASRRTDIPAYYSEWFMNRVKAGYVLTKNPMNPNQIKRIELSPDTIDCIVFWSKDPEPMLDKLPILKNMGYPYYFQFTLNPYDSTLERNLRPKEDILETFRCLAGMIGRDRVLWRYDPIILNMELTPEWHVESFRNLCVKLSAYTHNCTISFVDWYRKLARPGRMEHLMEITQEQMHWIAASFSVIAKEYGIELRACCEKTDFTMDSVKPAACIDLDIVERICGHSIKVKKDRNQREGCGCISSVAIGVYNTCQNGCVYCYANYSEASIVNNIRRYDPGADILIPDK